ncbi:MAG: metalloregulator ArsR/SmtB family transcription factor [Actinomycetota bacterium]
MDGFRAMGNPTRRRLLHLVAEHPRSVGELATAIDASQPATSQHLSTLRRAGLVTVEVDGRHRRYAADFATLGELRAELDRFWNGALDRLVDAATQHGQANARAAS